MSTQLLPTRSPEQHEASHDTTIAPARYIGFGTFHLDLKKEELFKDGTRVELRMQLWPSDTHVNYDANVNTTVNKLRQVLGDSPDQPAFVDTIPRKGYCFVAKVEYADQAVAPQTPPAPKPAGLSSVAALWERTESTASYFRAALTSRWFTAAVVTLVIASMLFGAALVLYAHR